MRSARAVPFGLTVANVRQNQFDVLWNTVAGAVSYTVTVTLASLSQAVRSVRVTENSLTVGNLEPGKLYNVTVYGIYSNGPGENSEPVQQITGKQFLE